MGALQGPAGITIANRTASRAADPAAAVGRGVFGSGFGELSGAFDVVVNATSASLSGAWRPFRDDVFAEGCLAYEVVYGKGMTPFLAQARTAGAGRLADGVGMLSNGRRKPSTGGAASARRPLR